MFGALNRFISRLDAEPQDRKQEAAGFQVLKSANPELAIEPWFDFIIGINGRTIDNPDSGLFAAEIRNSGGSTISLGVWSAKGQRIRELYVPVSKESAALGLSLQWAPLSTTEDVWHILDVTPDSPADLAGLLPYGDYVIGSPEGLVRGESGLGELVEDYLNRGLRLYIYNHEYNVTRAVTITPSRSWGGQGALGCVLGFGALHRIPTPLDEPPAAPGETLFATDLDEKAALAAADGADVSNPTPYTTDNLFVPASMMQAPATSPPPPAGGPPAGPARGRAKPRAHHNISPNSGIDEYFKEGEQKSLEQDVGGSSKPSAALPPPPKAGAAGGPPRGSSPSLAVPAAAGAGEVDEGSLSPEPPEE